MRRTLLVILFLVLVCAVGNLVVAIIATDENAPRATLVANLIGAEAAAAGWPAATPLPWPDVTGWSDERRFAYRRLGAWSWPEPPPDADQAKTTHQMELEEFGWPLPVLDRLQLWWPWEDPKWSTKVPHDSGLRIRWSGLALNSIMQALAIWLAVFGPFHLWSAALRWRRRSRGECLACGYAR